MKGAWERKIPTGHILPDRDATKQTDRHQSPVVEAEKSAYHVSVRFR